MDNDGYLDYVAIISMIYQKQESSCEWGSSSKVVITKVDLEKGLMNGWFPNVDLSVKTSLQESTTTEKAGQRFVLPIEKQKWTQYLGKEGRNTYSEA